MRKDGRVFGFLLFLLMMLLWLKQLDPITLLDMYYIYKRGISSKSENKWFVIVPMPNTYVSLQQGFFTEFLAVIGALVYAESQGACGVVVDFTEDSFYTRQHKDNWWGYYFNPIIPLRNCPLSFSNQDVVRFDGVIPSLVSFQAFIEGPNQKFRPYPLSYRTSPNRVGALVKKYIQFSPGGQTINSAVDLFLAQAGGSYKIGVHFRGTDKRGLYPYVSPSFAVFKRSIDNVIRQHPLYCIFIATDDVSFLTYMTEAYPTGTVKSLIADIRQGVMPMHKDVFISPEVKGDTAITDMLLLSKCNYIIKNRSSLSDVSIAFSSANYTMILGDTEIESFVYEK